MCDERLRNYINTKYLAEIPENVLLPLPILSDDGIKYGGGWANLVINQ